MIRKLMLVAAAPVALIVGVVTIGSAGGPDPCGEVAEAGTLSVTPRSGAAIAVAHDRTVSVVDALGGRTTIAAHGAGIPRHPSLGAGGELAYVEDRRGPDLLHAPGVPGSPFEGTAELMHPAWSPDGALAWVEGLERLRLRTPGGELRDLGGPPGTEGVFSPVFLDDGALVAVAIEPVGGYEGEDAALNDLWELDLTAGRWRQLTSFEAHGDAWSIARTPVAMADGELRFVRERGVGSGGAPPVVELWALDGEGPRFLRALPADTVLAGRLGERLVLNVPDGETGAYRLILEDGTDLGCGTAMADPLLPPDPDLLDEEEDEEADQGSLPADPTLSDGTLAIVVGDFETRGAAEAAAAGLTSAGEARLLTHDEAPGAVAPGVWAVAIGIREGVPIDEALETFRARFPQYRDRSWIAVP